MYTKRERENESEGSEKSSQKSKINKKKTDVNLIFDKDNFKEIK